MFACIVGKVCDRIERKTKIATVVTVFWTTIVLRMTTEIQHEGSNSMVYAD